MDRGGSQNPLGHFGPLTIIIHIPNRVSSRNFILGGKLTDHVAVKPWRGEDRLHNYNYCQYLGGGGGGGKLGQFGGEVELFGGGGPSHAPPSLDETLPNNYAL